MNSPTYTSLTDLAKEFKVDRRDLLRLVHERVIPPVINETSDDFVVKNELKSTVKARLYEIGVLS